MSGHSVTAEFLGRHPLPLPFGEVDKDARGRVVVVGGNREVPGAVLLTAVSALRAGAGKVQIATLASSAIALGIALPEARVIGFTKNEMGDIDPQHAEAIVGRIKSGDAVVLGPGMLDDQGSGALAATILQSVEGASFVLDAAALTGLSKRPECIKKHGGRVVLTPHAGEMASFLDVPIEEVEADPTGAARRAAAATGAVVLVKGSRTFIASPQGEIWESAHGNPGLAISGSGDILAGIIGGLLARGTSALLAAQWGVFMHGEAGARLKERHGLLGYLASEIPAEIPRIMANLGGVE